MRELTQSERLLVHQVHPVKLAVDISASVVSNVLLWKHCLVVGVAVRYLAPALGSALVLRFARIDDLALTPAGGYVLGHMPPIMVATRLCGDTLMALGAWRRRADYVAFGVLLVLLGWSHGLNA